jgi:ParB/RepB/Spo0J family partition protein
MSNTKLAEIPLNKIRENPNALREVNRSTEQYSELVDSIKKVGVMNAIVVRECKDPKTGEDFYGLIDGLHRFSAARDAGLETIPANIHNMQDADTMLAQIMANVHRVETKAGEYSKQLVRILALNPLMTMIELAGTLSKSTAWLNDRLSLVKLSEPILKLVDEGTINLSNAYTLAKLPVEEQQTFVDRAIAMPPTEFMPIANDRLKELRDAKRQGRNPNPEQFVPHATLRKMSEIEAAFTDTNTAQAVLQQNEVNDPVQAFLLGVKWTAQMDAQSVQMKKEKDEVRKRELQEKKDAAKRERDAKKQQEQAAKAAQVHDELANSQVPGQQPAGQPSETVGSASQ